MIFLSTVIKGIVLIGFIMGSGGLFYHYKNYSYQAANQEINQLSEHEHLDLTKHNNHNHDHTHHLHADDEQLYKRLKNEFLQNHEAHHHDKFNHKCDHGNFMKDREILVSEFEGEIPIESTLDHELSLLAEHKQGNWKPIRIWADYTNFKGNSQQLRFIRDKLIRASTGFLSAAYSVYPATLIKVTSCGADYAIPSQYNRGVSGYDLILFVGTSVSNEGWLARAGACQLDGLTYRPVAGTVEFNLQYLNQLNLNDPSDKSWFSWVQTTVHEMHHVLGFSPQLFKYFVDSSNNVPLGAAKISQNYDGRGWVITPKVVARVKGHFDCQTAQGAPLENDGGAGTAGAHWERVTFGNEAMTGSSIVDSVFTGFTFALLESTGWYVADYSQSEPFNWGEKEGCSIATAQCTQGLEFCSTGAGCSPDYMGLAGCSNKDQLAVGCSYWKAYSNTDCRFPAGQINQIAGDTGGTSGAGARCFVSSLPKAVGYSTLSSTCFKSECINDTSVKFYVGGKPYTCTYDDQVITVSFQGFSGTVKCPKIYRFCRTTRNCPNDCSGVGTCRQTVCNCYKGYAGADCSQEV